MLVRLRLLGAVDLGAATLLLFARVVRFSSRLGRLVGPGVVLVLVALLVRR